MEDKVYRVDYVARYTRIGMYEEILDVSVLDKPLKPIYMDVLNRLGMTFVVDSASCDSRNDQRRNDGEEIHITAYINLAVREVGSMAPIVLSKETIQKAYLKHKLNDFLSD